jgi:hypothetical protein
MTATVQGRGLTKRYRAVTALDEVGLALTLGRVYLLVGPNGAGKTTLFACWPARKGRPLPSAPWSKPAPQPTAKRPGAGETGPSNAPARLL